MSVGDQRVVHGGQRDGQRCGILEAHPTRNLKQSAVIGEGILRQCRGARSHHPIADLDALRIGTECCHFAGPLHAEHCADATGGAMGMPFGHAEVGAIEPACVHAHQNLDALRCRLGRLRDDSAICAVEIGFHELPPKISLSSASAPAAGTEATVDGHDHAAGVA